MSVPSKTDSFLIREVWNHNLESEIELIREIVDDYPLIAMDTEFPGRVLRPVEQLRSKHQNYQTRKINVDLLKLIQLGLTFADEKGNFPTCGTGKYCIWQFNFHEFNLSEDAYAHQSIQLLMESGIDFVKNREQGIDARRFGELLMSSGVVLNEDVQWVTFHGVEDFAYLLKLLTQKDLPDTLEEFLTMIKVFFPVLYDTKHMIRYHNSLHGGLSKVAGMLGVERVGTSHQAGSDSLLTWDTFFKVKENYFRGSLEKYVGVLFDHVQN